MMKTSIKLKPTVFAIFGGSGDLSWRKLAPSLFDVTVQFRAVPHKSFPPEATLDWQTSCLILSIQPDEGIVLRFQAKQPGTKLLLKPVAMRFNYQKSFSIPIPDAYETLLWDVMNNDTTLFMRADQVEAAWQIITPILDAWSDEHRVVFGMKHTEPELITRKLLNELHRISPYDTDHLPAEIELIEAFSQRHTKLPQVACSDTAFHSKMPRV